MIVVYDINTLVFNIEPNMKPVRMLAEEVDALRKELLDSLIFL